MTLVEVLACTAVACVLGLVIGTALVVMTRTSLQTRRRVELKREAALTIRLMKRKLRDRALDEVEISHDGQRLTLSDGVGGDQTVFEKVATDLLYTDDGKTDTLIAGKVEGMTCALETGFRPHDHLVRVALTLRREECTASIEGVAKLRN